MGLLELAAMALRASASVLLAASIAASAGTLAAPAPAASATGGLPACPGINPDIRRVPGSNCFGILPRSCGADRARGFIGRRYEEAVQQELADAVGNVRIRAFGERDAVTDDLRADRLNVVYDRARRIVRVDCY